MSQLNTEWKVGPHGPLEHLDDGLMTVAGEIVMPLGRFPRRMTVARLASGGTAIWSAIPLDKPAMAEIEAMGPPEVMVVPGIGHRLDAGAWKARYPAIKVICPPGAREKVAEAVSVDATEFSDDAVRLEVVPGTGEREAALVVTRGDTTTLVLNDVLANVQHPNGLGAQVMARLMGFGVHHPQIPWVGKRMFVDDKEALAAAFRRWAALPGLARIVVSHGDVIADDPRGELERVAESL